jgi:ubiquinone biosynthesis monooxygenase Coq7
MSLVIRTLRRSSLSAARPYSSSSVKQGLASSVYVEQRPSFSPATHETPSDLTRPEREALEAALRVDQAGEVAANYIYMGQLAVLGRDPRVGPLIQVRTSLSLDIDRRELRVE